jgi:hypothetical protein
VSTLKSFFFWNNEWNSLIWEGRSEVYKSVRTSAPFTSTDKNSSHFLCMFTIVSSQNYFLQNFYSFSVINHWFYTLIHVCHRIHSIKKVYQLLQLEFIEIDNPCFVYVHSNFFLYFQKKIILRFLSLKFLLNSFVLRNISNLLFVHFSCLIFAMHLNDEKMKKKMKRRWE